MTITEKGTRLQDLKQPPLNTTMMGVLKASADYHGLGLSEPLIFGLSGHAFLINIHEELCPSGPYCWKRELVNPLIQNAGLKMTDLGFFAPGSSEEDRRSVEDRLREALDRGIPCSLMNMENQTISGYGEDGFFTEQPWPHDFPPARLSFGSWKEFGDEFHTNFYTIEKCEPTVRNIAVRASLEYAVDVWRNPGNHHLDRYGVGPNAYDNYVRAVPTHGGSHGNWWNATVWSECRRMAAGYVAWIGTDIGGPAELCSDLSSRYMEISKNLERASDKEMEPSKKISLLKQTKDLEASAIENVEALLNSL